MNRRGTCSAKLFTSVIAISAAAVLIALLAGCTVERPEVVGLPKSFADLADRVEPAVVNISATTTVKVPGFPFRHFFGQGPFGDFLGKFHGDIPDREMRQRSLGSGFIVDKDGYIITNNHVVEGAQEIKVKLTDGREFGAKVIGKDPKTDLALIKISSLFKDLPVLALGDSDKIRVGDWVIAVGNPFGLEHTVTQGIISATGRVIGSGPYDNFLQTDAPINPGNSGGPLINVMGEVVGVNSAIIAGGQGIGFAIPSNMAKSVSAQLKEKGKVTRGWIGVSIQSVSPEIAKAFGLKEEKGALVADVVAGSPAEAAGIKRGDIIVSFDGKEIKNSTDLPVRVAETPLGKTVTVRVLREGKETDLSVKVSEMPEGKFAALAGSRESSLGLAVKDITPELRRQLGIREKSGIIVIDVASGSPAEDAGLQAGDVIKEVNRKPVKSVKDYVTLIAKAREDEPLLLLIQRGNQTIFVAIPM